MENKTDRPAEGTGQVATSTAEQVAQAIEYLAANAADRVTLTGESLESHARGTIAILEGLRVDAPSLQAAALFLLPTLAMDNEKALEPAFGAEVVKLVHDVRQLLRIGAIAGLASPTDAGVTRKNEAEARRAQVEALRKMLLAFAQDIRVVLIRLASRLQSLRWLAQTKRPAPEGMARSRNIVIEFPDYATALACYRSSEYQENIKRRLPHSAADIVIIEGYDGPQPG